MTNSRAKGSAGEREFCAYIEARTGLVVKRNLAQSRDGQWDILLPFNGRTYAVEVKRRRGQPTDSDREAWMNQVERARKGTPYWPLVAYRSDRQRWRVIDQKMMDAPVDMTLDDWLNLDY